VAFELQQINHELSLVLRMPKASFGFEKGKHVSNFALKITHLCQKRLLGLKKASTCPALL
jgi:hypothetical protein